MVAGFWPAQLVVAATLCETVDLRRLNGPLAQRLEQWIIIHSRAFCTALHEDARLGITL